MENPLLSYWKWVVEQYRLEAELALGAWENDGGRS